MYVDIDVLVYVDADMDMDMDVDVDADTKLLHLHRSRHTCSYRYVCGYRSCVMFCCVCRTIPNPSLSALSVSTHMHTHT